MSAYRVLCPNVSRALLCRQWVQTVSKRQYSQRRIARPLFAQSCKVDIPRPQVWARWHSAPASASKLYDFAKVPTAGCKLRTHNRQTLKTGAIAMKAISDEASPDRILIDVREPPELEAGYIPGAINIPISSQPDALFLPEDEFEDRFGFSKPDKTKEVVFYCKAGVRASAAAQLAEQQGYKHIAEYRGSMLDWNKQGGPLEKP